MENYENKSVKIIEGGDVILTVLLVALGLIIGFICSFVYYNFVKVPSLMEQSAQTQARTQLAYASLVMNSDVQLFDCVVKGIDGNTLVGNDLLGDQKQTRTFLISDQSQVFKREVISDSSAGSSSSSNPGEIKLSDIKIGDKVHVEAKKVNENNQYPAEKIFLIVLR